MKKYWLIIKNTWAEYAAYRLNFILWRVRVVIRFLITFFLWSSIYSGDQNYFGYTRSTMLTYILLVYVVSNFVFATRTQEIGSIINEGSLTNYILKPLNFFKNLAARDLSDKLLNFGFTVFEFGILFYILKIPLLLQTNFWIIIISLLAFIGSVIIYFCISSLLGLIGFWTNEVWATRFIFIVLLDFIAGNFFPIDILPNSVVNFLSYTPFPYIFYFPVKIYLGQLTTIQIFQGIFMACVWSVILSLSVARVWKNGLRVYSAEGR